MSEEPKNNLTTKQRLGALIIPKIPFSRHVFNHFRLELNAWLIRSIHPLNLGYQAKLQRLKQQKELLVNIGCGPFGKADWVNLDLYPHPNLTLRVDSRRKFPLANNSCLGIHVEHFLEHLNPTDELPQFLQECRRCLQPGGVLRIIVPNAEVYIKAYLEPGWGLLNEIGCGGDKPEEVFKTKMEALNHVFVQEWEHYGGYDAETLELMLLTAGFTQVTHCSYGQGEFPGGCIDREQHRPYSLYFEAKKLLMPTINKVKNEDSYAN